ncbi:MAG TPA: hypothetical protein VK985_07465 [Rariglobus sp.]|nr:hypothetical protein [Rariglobus sp.]
MSSPRSRPQSRRSGFALLITITLLAFLVLLLVSLASLTRVETQVASNNQQIAQARQNAILALNVALGRLQSAAGPDQRVTAAADIVSGRDLSKKYWTGVWNASAAGADKNIAWLVSGTAPAGSAGVTTALTAATGNTLVDLVGDNSTDTAAPAGDGNRVRVETQPIKTTGIPGLDPSTEATVGNFAWWVGDEGVKAKVSLGDPWKKPPPADTAGTAAFTALLSATSASEAHAETFSFFGLQRTGIEGSSSAGANSATTGKIAGAYPVSTNPDFRSALPKVVSLSQLPLSSAANQATLQAAIKSRFHDLTASSRSLLTDVSSGGLKRDLTAWLVAPAGPANPPFDSDYLLPPAYTLPADPAERYGLPRWGIIRSYAGIEADNSAKPSVLPTDTQQGIHPVMTFGRLGLAVSCEGVGSPLRLHLFPHLVLWNPTNVTITGDYEFCFGFPGNPQAFFKFNAATGPTAQTQLHVRLGYVSLSGPTDRNGSVPAEYFRFLVRIPSAGIAPGQSLAFTLSDTSSGTPAPYASGSNLMEANNPVATDNSVTMDGRIIDDPADLTRDLYFDLHSGNMDMLLCPVATGSTPPAAADLRAGAYQAGYIAYGYGGPGTTPPRGPAQPAATVLGPIIDYRLGMRFSQRAASSGASPRWLATLNPRAGLLLRKRTYFGNTTAPPYTATPNVSGNENSAAVGITPAVVGGVPARPVLFEFRPPGVPLFSLAQLQHAGLSLINLNPAYAVGNSIADYNVPRDQTSFLIGLDTDSRDSLRRIYDLSYLLNQTLWDRYFFSTVPASLTASGQLTADYRLPNSRHELHWRSDPAAEFPELKTADAAAAHLLVNGGFNVNSTSVQAWRALLYSHNADPSQPASVPFSRFAKPRPGDTPNSIWNGWRVLTEPQLDNLATRIVDQVKARGPFLSLADFVNRSLADNPATAGEDERLKGALQAALDAGASPYAGNSNQLSDFTTNANYRIASYPTAVEEERERYRGGSDAAAPYASTAAFAPGFLTQADLLNALGPVLAARSDTFRIRAYGDVLNPATGNTTPEARAWCEAIVQRMPDYVDSANNPSVAPGSATATNQTFGRRFKIVSFQWLSASDI